MVTIGDIMLFMITKIQKLSAIHNYRHRHPFRTIVVYDYKDTKIVSNSQPEPEEIQNAVRCL